MTQKPPPRTPKPPVKDKQTASFYMALLAIIISMIGTGVSIVEAGILRDQQKLMSEEKAAAVWPYIQVTRNIEQDSTGYFLSQAYKNKGIGPAILTVKHTIEGEAIKNILELKKSLGKLIPAQQNLIPLVSKDIIDVVLSPGEEVVSYKIYFPGEGGNDQLEQSVLPVVEHFLSQACYHSVYGDSWCLTENQKPEPCPDCAAVSAQ